MDMLAKDKWNMEGYERIEILFGKGEGRRRDGLSIGNSENWTIW